jgi:hypothetical protein
MALAYSYNGPQPYVQNPDIAGSFARGFQGVRSVTDELNAEQTLSDLARSLGVQQGAPASTAPAAQPQSLSDLIQSPDPGNQIIGGSAAAATNATDPALAGYFKTLATRESSNNPNATNPNSSAGGLYQITDPTWQALVQQNPNAGLTPDGKMDPQQQQIAVRLLTNQNANALRQAGQPINPSTLYAAHLLGAPTATQVLGYADETPMASVVPNDVVQANPQLAHMTVGQFKAWAGQSGTNPNGGYAPPTAGQPMAPGLPSQDVLTSLLQNPVTRDVGMTLLSRQIDPTYQLDLQGKEADNALKLAQAKMYSQFGGKIPPGYQVGPNGLSPIPGGPADPNNPLNYNKVNPFGQTTAPDGSGGAPTADQVPVQLGQDGRPDPTQQQAYISSLPPGLQPLVKGVVTYTMDPNKVVSLKGNARTQLIAAAKAADPSFDMAQYPARAAMVKSLASGPLQQTLTSVNTTIQHLGELDNQVESLGNTNFTPWNSVKNAYESATGNPAQTTFAQTAQAAADEMAKFFKGAGASDVQSIRDWQSTLSSASSPAQLHAAIQNAVGNLMQAKLNTIQEQYQKVMGGQQLPGFLSSQSLATLSKMGINPASLDPEAAAAASTPPPPSTSDNASSAFQEGATATNPQTGAKIIFRGGQWVPLQ